jgi:MFS family permease
LPLLAGSWMLGRHTPGDRGLVTLSVVIIGVFGVVMLGMAGAPTVAWLVPLYLVGGLSNGGINLIGGVLQGRRVEPSARGRVNAAIGGGINAGVLVGFVIGGLLLRAIDPRMLFAVTGVAGLLVAAVLAAPVLRTASRPAPSGASGPVPAGPEPATPGISVS